MPIFLAEIPPSIRGFPFLLSEVSFVFYEKPVSVSGILLLKIERPTWFPVFCFEFPSFRIGFAFGHSSFPVNRFSFRCCHEMQRGKGLQACYMVLTQEQ
jgi:hypothetical protein